MQQVFFGIILFLGFTTYYLYQQNQTLQANNLALEVAISTQEETIKSIQADFELQSQQMQELSVKSQKAQRELNRLNQELELQKNNLLKTNAYIPPTTRETIGGNTVL